MKGLNFNSGDEGLITYKSSNPFEFYHILNSQESDEQDMFGTLILQMKRRKNILLLSVCMEAWDGEVIITNIQ